MAKAENERGNIAASHRMDLCSVISMLAGWWTQRMGLSNCNAPLDAGRALTYWKNFCPAELLFFNLIGTK